MKIRTSNEATDKFSDDDHMPHDYEVVFDEEGGTVATVRKEVGESLAAAEDYPGIEAVEDPSPPPDDEDSGEGESADSDDDDAGGEDEQTDDSDTGSDTE